MLIATQRNILETSLVEVTVNVRTQVNNAAGLFRGPGAIYPAFGLCTARLTLSGDEKQSARIIPIGRIHGQTDLGLSAVLTATNA